MSSILSVYYAVIKASTDLKKNKHFKYLIPVQSKGRSYYYSHLIVGGQQSGQIFEVGTRIPRRVQHNQ